MFTIERELFEEYSVREEKYILEEVEVEYLDTRSKNDNSLKTYILRLKNEYIYNDISIYYLYDKTCRNGAYEQDIEFGELYDESTYTTNGELSYVEIMKRYFSIGEKVLVTSNYNTINKFPGEKFIINKSYGEVGIIISTYKSNVELLFNNGTKVFFDIGDLSLLPK